MEASTFFIKSWREVNVYQKLPLCPSSADVAATISIPNSLRVICLSTNKVPIASHLKAASDISWHLQLPYLAVASDCRILLWKNDKIKKNLFIY
ncbi:hypothetical protein Avbf_06536 [Armadillidium vulgare]|nr:hypothetical protein Avbf_06536 [Armadillidium vulgare]